MMRRSSLISLLCLLALGTVNADQKVWQKNTNYDDPANWNGGGVLCANDRKVFPKDMQASVYIQKNESLQELVLSNNMVLVFEPGAVLTFTEEPTVLGNPRSAAARSSPAVSTPRPATQDICIPKGRVLSFMARAASWFDPSSWQSSSAANRNESRQLLLDLDQVPCKQDSAVFPSQDSFQVNMENQGLDVGTITIRNEKLQSNDQFNSYWKKEVSQYDFVNRTQDNHVTGQTCSDGYCFCPDRYSEERRALVCKYMSNVKNMSEVCQVPISPAYGHCSELCGASLVMHFNSTDSIMTDLSLIWSDIHNSVLEALQTWPGVFFNIGHYKNGKAEIVFTDNNDGRTASISLCDVRSSVLTNASSLGIVELTFVRSDGVDNCDIPATQAPHGTSGKHFDFVILAVALSVGILFIILVILGFIIYRRKYKATLKNELELGSINNGNRLTSQGFDNPMYDSPLPFDDNFVITYETDTDQIRGFENATYSADPSSRGRGAVKKRSIDDSASPVATSSKKGEKNKKSAQNVGFDNPVYDIQENEEGDNSNESGDRMVSVPLDEEDQVTVPERVEFDGTGFANPIATGLSESMMKSDGERKASIEVPKTTISKQMSAGFENPLYTEPEHQSDNGAGTSADITVQVASQPKKKKKDKKRKSKVSKGAEVLEEEGDGGDLGFGNPMYEAAEEPKDLYQPTGGPPKFDIDEE